MGKLIAVWGTPNSGKTALTMKLAEALYTSERHRRLMIMVVFTDVIAPSIPVIFPSYKDSELYSIGALLAKTSLTADDVFSYTTFMRGRDNLGFLGYKDSENCHSHPQYTKEKAREMYDILKANTDYVIVDCMTRPKESLITETALLIAEHRIWMVTPDLKAISYSLSQKNLLMAQGFLRQDEISVMNVPVAEFAMPIPTARAYMGNVQYTLPYSSSLAEQSVEGSLSEPLKDRRFTQALSAIMSKVR